jgi:hypothetical protein
MPPNIPDEPARDEAHDKKRRHIYQGVTSTEKAKQMNGDVGCSDKSRDSGAGNEYTNITAKDESLQINGNTPGNTIDILKTLTH